MPQKRTHIRPGQKLELALTPRERRAILDHLLCLPPEYATLLGKTPADEPLLLTLDDLDDFSGYVAAESNHTPDKRLRTILHSAFRKMTALLDTFTDEGPPVTRPTKPTKPASRPSSPSPSGGKPRPTRLPFSPLGPPLLCGSPNKREPRTRSSRASC
jgi:hypothetical protein